MLLAQVPHWDELVAAHLNTSPGGAAGAAALLLLFGGLYNLHGIMQVGAGAAEPVKTDYQLGQLTPGVGNQNITLGVERPLLHPSHADALGCIALLPDHHHQDAVQSTVWVVTILACALSGHGLKSARIICLTGSRPHALAHLAHSLCRVAPSD